MGLVTATLRSKHHRLTNKIKLVLFLRSTAAAVTMFSRSMSYVSNVSYNSNWDQEMKFSRSLSCSYSVGENKKWVYEPEKLILGEVSYVLKLIGQAEVSESNGGWMIEECISKIALGKNESVKATNVRISISIQRLEIQTKRNKQHFQISQIIDCVQDKILRGNKIVKIFAIIVKDDNSGKLTCIVFQSNDQANIIDLTVKQAKELVENLGAIAACEEEDHQNLINDESDETMSKTSSQDSEERNNYSICSNDSISSLSSQDSTISGNNSLIWNKMRNINNSFGPITNNINSFSEEDLSPWYKREDYGRSPSMSPPLRPMNTTTNPAMIMPMSPPMSPVMRSPMSPPMTPVMARPMSHPMTPPMTPNMMSPPITNINTQSMATPPMTPVPVNVPPPPGFRQPMPMPVPQPMPIQQQMSFPIFPNTEAFLSNFESIKHIAPPTMDCFMPQSTVSFRPEVGHLTRPSATDEEETVSMPVAWAIWKSFSNPVMSF